MDCKICGKRLVPIGYARKNGKNHEDWYNREYHKKCYLQKLDIDRVEEDMKKYKMK